MSYNIPFDITTYIAESIHEVYKTLFEALFLVILVVFLSLQSWRASLIPLVAVPVSLIGTFGFMLAFGFSLNMLTLLGLVLAIGIVVDDAIVVVEGVRTYHGRRRIVSLRGYPQSHERTDRGTRGHLARAGCRVRSRELFARNHGYALPPVCHHDCRIRADLTGRGPHADSASVPYYCVPPTAGKTSCFARSTNGWHVEITNTSTCYNGQLARPRRIIAWFGMAIVLIVVLNRVIPSSFLPEEDQGYFKVELALPEGATLERTRKVTERAVDYLKDHPAVAYVQSVAGSSPRVGTNQSRTELTVILKPWEERKKGNLSLEEVMSDVRSEFKKYPEALVFLSTPPVIPGLGTSGGFELQVEARNGATFENLVEAVDTLVKYAAKDKALTGVSSSLQAEIPQLYFDVDRDKAQFLGIPLADIFSTMKAYTGSVYVNDFNMFNRVYKVYMQAEAPYRMQKEKPEYVLREDLQR